MPESAKRITAVMSHDAHHPQTGQQQPKSYSGLTFVLIRRPFGARGANLFTYKLTIYCQEQCAKKKKKIIGVMI